VSPEEAVMLCRYVRACCPQQAIDEYTPIAWADHLEHVTYDDAKIAAKAITARQPFVQIAELKAEVKRIRAKRIELHPPLTPPPAPEELDSAAQVRWQIAWTADAKRRIADGEQIDSDAAYGELKARHLPDMKALMASPESDDETEAVA